MRVLAYPRSTLIAAISAILPVQAQTVAQPSPGEEEVAYLPGGELMTLRWIPSGSDAIGTTPERAKRLLVLGAHKTEVEGEQPAHLFQTRGFYMGQYEITQKQWVSVMGTAPWGHYLPYDPDAPAVCISWDGAVGFVAALNRALGADLYRLPTEEEWEYACRAGTDTIWYFGDSDDELGEHAWVFANSAADGIGPLHPVGQKDRTLGGCSTCMGTPGSGARTDQANMCTTVSSVPPGLGGVNSEPSGEAAGTAHLCSPVPQRGRPLYRV